MGSKREIEEEEVMGWSSSMEPQLSLNHVSFVCKSVSRSVRFYEEVLGFVLIKRPSSFNFEGAWLFNHGIGIHLLESNSPNDIPDKKGVINPKDNHISFQCSDLWLVIRKLKAMNIQYVKGEVEEGGVKVDQLFFHDPDGYMIEICNCENLPILPLSSCPLKKLPYSNRENDMSLLISGEQWQELPRSEKALALIINNLVTDMMVISF
ncbi:metallothiol transferase FosB-like isoform X1 [Telopea speciosissima]|uniref:metallothiol transferase FosB-like isoform X1 n=2 Tax=Telopea speciosissima TaxID=54955 RepID=UPI001CC73408|nr:metallothiol transferase FosB-like isoform X1 [Telopea speciosissima]